MVDKYRTLIISAAVFKIVFAKVVITLFFIFIFIQKRIYMRFLLIYTCLHLIIPKTMLSVYVNNRDLLCKNKESSASGKNRIMQREQTKKKDSFKGEFNPAKNRNTRDPSSSVQKLFTSDDQYCEINTDAQISLLFFFKYHIVYITFLDIFYIYSAFK